MKSFIIIITAVAALSGCALRHVESDIDATRYKDIWEMGGIEQQLISLSVTGENIDDPAAGAAVTRAFLNTAKFRIAQPGETPSLNVHVHLRESRTTFTGHTIRRGLFLFIIPTESQRRLSEVSVEMSDAAGRKLEHVYAQTRGKSVLWLGYALWPSWIWNRERARVMRDDAIKAAVVRTTRTIAVEAQR